MLSRTANTLYWMSRYLERAESTARLIDVNYLLGLDLPDEDEEAWEAVIATTGDLDAYRDRFGPVNRAGAVRFLAFDPGHANSLLACVASARENARTVREHLPMEAWEAVNTLFLELRGLAGAPMPGAAGAVHAVRVAGRRLEGLLELAYPRDEGWQFLRLGRQVERADQTSRLVDVQSAQLEGRSAEPTHALRWDAVLRSVNALEVFRRQHGTTTSGLAQAAAFLLLDGAFPASVAFCLREADEALRAIGGTPAGQYRNAAEKLLGRLAAELRYTDFADLLAEGLHRWLDRFQARLNDAGEALQAAYFEPPAGDGGNGVPDPGSIQSQQ